MENALAFIGRNFFLIFGLMAVGAAVAMVFSKSAVHSVLSFLFAMLSIAGCYLSLQAEFVGVAQILVYAGGIVVLFLFVVMLVELTRFKEAGGIFHVQTPWAVVAVLGACAVFIYVFRGLIFDPASKDALVLKPELAQGLDVASQNAQAVSRGLFAEYLLPFEILSVILLVALVAAVAIAKQERA
ncbi:MAG: NADH-quinone oxidoreductase subunit J [Acidobacteria bacterium]|nr:NADH-quinone oxidoreductase subunit J [Acidobacteriota bacterium]